MCDRVAAATTPLSNYVTASGATGSFSDSEDYVRQRLHSHLTSFLTLAAAM